MEGVSALLFLAVLPVGLPAALHIASGFWLALFDLDRVGLLAIELATLAAILLLGQRPPKASGLLQGLIAVAIVASVALIWWMGDLPRTSQPLLPAMDGQWHLLPTALGVMFWCFVGIEAFTHLGEEFKRPERDFPLALLLGVLLAGLVYWACSVAVLSFATYGDVHSDTTALPRLFEQLLGEQARALVAVLGYLACFASMNVYIQGFARLIWSLAEEGRLPASLAVRNRQGVPGKALLLVVITCALCAVLSATLKLSVDDLIRYANGNFVLIYLFSMAAGWVLLRGIWRLLAGLSTLLCAAVLVMLGSDALYAVALLVALLLLDHLRARHKVLA